MYRPPLLWAPSCTSFSPQAADGSSSEGWHVMPAASRVVNKQMYTDILEAYECSRVHFRYFLERLSRFFLYSQINHILLCNPTRNIQRKQTIPIRARETDACAEGVGLSYHSDDDENNSDVFLSDVTQDRPAQAISTDTSWQLWGRVFLPCARIVMMIN